MLLLINVNHIFWLRFLWFLRRLKSGFDHRILWCQCRCKFLLCFYWRGWWIGVEIQYCVRRFTLFFKSTKEYIELLRCFQRLILSKSTKKVEIIIPLLFLYILWLFNCSKLKAIKPLFLLLVYLSKKCKVILLFLLALFLYLFFYLLFFTFFWCSFNYFFDILLTILRFYLFVKLACHL